MARTSSRTRRRPRRGGPSNDGQLADERPVHGVDMERVRSNPDEFVGELAKGAQIKSIDIPSEVVAGGTIQITGELLFDNIGVVISGRDCRIKVEGPSLSEPRYQTFEDLTHGNTRTFSIEVPVTAPADSSMAFSVKAQSNVYGNWATGQTHGPVRLNVYSAEEKRTRDRLDVIPYAVGGAGAGYAAGSVLENRNPTNLAVAGAAVGVGAKSLGDKGVQFLPSMEFPTTKVAVLGGTAVALALLLNSTGVSEVLQPAGEAAGGAISTARDASGRLYRSATGSR